MGNILLILSRFLYLYLTSIKTVLKENLTVFFYYRNILILLTSKIQYKICTLMIQ